MFDDRHYVPVLQWKQGEYHALRDLTDSARDRMTPLLVVPAVPWDFKEDEPAKTMLSHLEGMAERIARYWGTRRAAFVDAIEVAAGDVGQDSLGGIHPLAFILDEARRMEVDAIPVVGTGRDTAYLEAARSSAREDGLGACIRLTSDDLDEADELDANTADLCDALDLEPQDVDIVLDFGSVPGEAAFVRTLRRDFIATLSEIPNVDEWRTLTVVATGFPRDLSRFGPNSVNHVERVEWQAWQQMRARSIARLPTFGDYAISHPAPITLDPRILVISASLRYTAANQWVIVKGRSTKDHGWGQMHQLSARLRKMDEFAGPEFSAGDRYIDDCADQRVSSGNATTWRRVGTNHHLTLVTEQIANLPAS